MVRACRATWLDSMVGEVTRVVGVEILDRRRRRKMAPLVTCRQNKESQNLVCSQKSPLYTWPPVQNSGSKN